MQGSDGVGGAGVPCPIDEHVGDGLVLDLICLAAVPKEGAEDVCPLFGGDVFEVARGFVCSVDGAVGGEGDAFALECRGLSLHYFAEEVAYGLCVLLSGVEAFLLCYEVVYSWYKCAEALFLGEECADLLCCGFLYGSSDDAHLCLCSDQLVDLIDVGFCDGHTLFHHGGELDVGLLCCLCGCGESLHG